MKRILTAVALATAFLSGSTFAAPIFTLTGGYTGPITIKFKDFENVSPGLAVGAENFGVVNVTTVTDPIGNNLWVAGGANGFLTGVFADIAVTSVVPDGSGGLKVSGTGGHMDLWLSSTSLDPTQGIGGYVAAGGGCVAGNLCYHTVTDTGDGIHFLSLDFVSGVDPANAATTVVGNFDSSTFPTTGDANSFLDVVGGVYASHFDTNGQPTGFGNRDIFISNTFCPNGVVTCGTVGDWQLLSDDPARANFIPEPNSLALAGLALLVLGGLQRRIRK